MIIPSVYCVQLRSLTMKTTLVVLALAIAAVSGQTGRIVGGETTTIDQYPSVVQVDFYNVFSSAWAQSCAGSVLNELWVLSAAQCFLGEFSGIENRRIRAGSSDRNIGGLVSGIQSVVIHADFDADSLNADIALVRLLNYLVYSPAVRPVTIITQGYEVLDATTVTQVGWGRTEEDGYPSSQLREVGVYTMNREACAEVYSQLDGTVTDNMICTGVPEGGRGACYGDNGGPTYYGNILIGIISWGKGCADAEYPMVNTRVASYTNWIATNAQ